MKIEVYEDTEGWWRWHFRSNGRITAQGESHLSKAKAVRAAKAVAMAVTKAAYRSRGDTAKPFMLFTTYPERGGVTTIQLG